MPDDRPRFLRLSPDDNVAIIANAGGLRAGARFPDGLELIEDIPQAHKVALRDIAAGDPILRYGVRVGQAAEDIRRGAWVTEARTLIPPSPSLEELRRLVAARPATNPPPRLQPDPAPTFEGFRNPDGSVGSRNLLAISTTVQCVAPVARIAAERIRAELLPKYPHVDGVTAIEHIYGCGVAIDAPDAHIPIRSLRNIAKNPNFGGFSLLLSLGCEKFTPERFFPDGPPADPRLPDGGAPQVITLQDEEHQGFEAMLKAVMRAAEKRLAAMDARRRQTCPASDLALGLQCGGSDAFSGAVANPAAGVAADLVVRAGGTAFFSEITEVRDGIAQLAARAADNAVANDLIECMAWYDAYLARGGADRSANTTPGNKKGGINNIVEKAMGSIAKSGSQPIHGVFGIGEKIPPDRKGLFFAASPASDLVCGPSQVAAGMNVMVFVTGRGTPYGLAEVPVIKMVTRSELARQWHDLVDIDAGRILSGDATIESLGAELFQLILDVAAGRRTQAEKLGLHNYLAVFNPAPIT
ncbi:MAG: galactarate dehydratase [Planctomycetota bacterium]|jgi:galactarate dehydratase|nr:galactarate dehydratase [Planctomycetota bacterium]